MRCKLQGYITEKHLAEAESEFPGISRYFAACPEKPKTFLQLVWQYRRYYNVR
jgi:hypothetical protein